MNILDQLVDSDRHSYQQRISNCKKCNVPNGGECPNMYEGHSVEIIIDKISGQARLNSYECKHYHTLMKREEERLKQKQVNNKFVKGDIYE
jgi:hypothetical protein